MRAGIEFSVTPEDRRRLDAIVDDRNSPQKHVARARALIATAEGLGTAEVMRRSGRSKPAVWPCQALDRTQPGLPLKKGRAGTMTHDYKRHGTTTLFSALNTLDGSVIGRCMQRHRHQEFIRFLNQFEAEVPVGKVVHVIVDNYATH